MPILNREDDIHPPNLLAEGHAAAPWWVVYTLSRREKTLMRQLRDRDIGFYCPLVAKKTRSPAGRVRVSYAPLFSGYLFLNGDDEQRRDALTTNCISRVLPVANPEQLVTDLAQIQLLIQTEKPVTHEAKIEAGQAVRVKSGKLAGIEGVVEKRKGADHLIVIVKFLQQGASIEIADFEVERA